MVTAKLRVPAGAPDQDSRGGTLPPVQPNRSADGAGGNVPRASSGLVRRKWPACFGTAVRTLWYPKAGAVWADAAVTDAAVTATVRAVMARFLMAATIPASRELVQVVRIL